MCGTRLAPGGTETEAPTVFGRPPPLAPTVAIAAAVALLVWLFVGGRFALGVAAAVLVAIGAGAWIALSRREAPGAPGRSLRQARERALFAAGSVRSWSAAARAILPLRRELRTVHAERNTRVLALGEAALREDEEATSVLRGAVRELDERAGELERRMQEIAESTRQRVEHERLTVQPTLVARPDDPPDGEAGGSEVDENDAEEPPGGGNGVQSDHRV